MVDWLHERGRFAGIRQHGSTPRTPRIRLLMCERIGWRPLGFAMSRESYSAVEEAFGFSSETIPILDQNNGQQYCDMRFDSTGNNLDSIGECSTHYPI